MDTRLKIIRCIVLCIRIRLHHCHLKMEGLNALVVEMVEAVLIYVCPYLDYHKSAGEDEHDSMAYMAKFHMGGPGTAAFNYKQILISNYEFNEQIWDIVLNKEKLGCFEYISRGISEENIISPRPVGAEFTMLNDSESRCVKYS